MYKHADIFLKFRLKVWPSSVATMDKEENDGQKSLGSFSFYIILACPSKTLFATLEILFSGTITP